jgi:hypothetical protein
MNGLHEVVHHDEQTQGVMGLRHQNQNAHIPLPFARLCDTLLHVNLSYSDSHGIFLLAPGDEVGLLECWGECGAVKQWEMTSLLCAHCLPANRAFIIIIIIIIIII